ncbi:hypothetical protein BJ741DRAFT_116293 [Chytriomyces cf. hyalinus JEL632]|nr:hypothetical protein BJ741DRAFT_116293 [Chytriomyces cf. hyalinus JEL632]
MGQRKNQNATVAAVQQNIQQQPAWNAKMTMNQKPATPASKPMTRLATPAQAPMQAKPAPMQPAKAATSKQMPARPAPMQPAKAATSKQMPARAAPMAVDTFSGNMFDLPSQWVASCKPASPVARLAAKAKASKPKFTRKPRAPKNSTSEVFNLQFLFNEPTQWATVQACAPKRMPMQMKQMPVQMMKSMPMQAKPMQQQPQKAMAKPATPMQQQPQKVMAKPATPMQQQPQKAMAKPATPMQSANMEQCLMSMFAEPAGWATQAPTAPRRAAGSQIQGNLPNLPAKQRLRV